MCGITTTQAAPSASSFFPLPEAAAPPGFGVATAETLELQTLTNDTLRTLNELNSGSSSTAFGAGPPSAAQFSCVQHVSSQCHRFRELPACGSERECCGWRPRTLRPRAHTRVVSTACRRASAAAPTQRLNGNPHSCAGPAPTQTLGGTDLCLRPAAGRR